MLVVNSVVNGALRIYGPCFDLIRLLMIRFWRHSVCCHWAFSLFTVEFCVTAGGSFLFTGSPCQYISDYFLLAGPMAWWPHLSPKQTLYLTSAMPPTVFLVLVLGSSLLVSRSLIRGGIAQCRVYVWRLRPSHPWRAVRLNPSSMQGNSNMLASDNVLIYCLIFSPFSYVHFTPAAPYAAFLALLCQLTLSTV